MKSISIKELHDRTGHWLRQVNEEQEVVVTERGKPVARMLPAIQSVAKNPFQDRKLLPGVARLMDRRMAGPDSAAVISEGRDGR